MAPPLADIQRGLALVPEIAVPAGADRAAAGRRALRHRRPPAGPGAGRQEALRLAREAGDRDAEAQALAKLAMIEAGPAQLAVPRQRAVAAAGAGRGDGSSGPTPTSPSLKLVIPSRTCCAGRASSSRRPRRTAGNRRRGAAWPCPDRRGVPRDQPGGAAVLPGAVGRGGRGGRACPRPCAAAAAPGSACGSFSARSRWPGATSRPRPGARRQPGDAVRRRLRGPVPPAAGRARDRVTLAAEARPPRSRPRPRRSPGTTCRGSSPRYAWPLVVTAAIAALRGTGRRRRARCLTGCGRSRRNLTRSGRYSRPGGCRSPRSTRPRGRAAASRTAAGIAAADAAVAAWEELGQPYPAAVALIYAARDGAGRRAAARRWSGCAGRRPSPSGSAPRPLAEQIAELDPPGRRGRGRPGDPASPAVSSRCFAWSRRASPTGRSRPRWSSRPRRPASTCPTSSPSWAPRPGPRRRSRRTS